MSKKIALGAKKLVLDVKVGSGALIKNIKDATTLANIMISIGKQNGIEVVCILTNMDIPLGTNIGNSLEVEEAIKILKDHHKSNLTDLCIAISSEMVSLGLNISLEEAKSKVIEHLDNGDAYKKFLELIKYQHGDIDKLPISTKKYEIKSMTTGYLTDIDAYKLGLLSMSLGAGRKTKEDTLDYSAGIIVHKNINDYINSGDIIMTLYTNKDINSIDNTIFKVSKDKIEEPKLIYNIIR